MLLCITLVYRQLLANKHIIVLSTMKCRYVVFDNNTVVHKLLCLRCSYKCVIWQVLYNEVFGVFSFRCLVV